MAVRRISELDLITDSITSNEKLHNYYIKDIDGNFKELNLTTLSTNLYFEASLSTNSENNIASYYKSVKLTPALLGQVIVMGDTATSVLVDKITGNQIAEKLTELTVDLEIPTNLSVAGNISCDNDITCANLSASKHISCNNLTATTDISCANLSARYISCNTLTATTDISCANLSARYISCNTLTATTDISCANLSATNRISCTNITCASKAMLSAAWAHWADFAENYEADAEYPAGTLIEFGGEKEITIAKHVANGIVTTNPGFLINSGCKGLATGIAIAGKVPIRVIGKVQKFDNLTLSNIPGVAAVSKLCEDVIIGKALETNESEDEKLVMCVSKFNFK